MPRSKLELIRSNEVLDISDEIDFVHEGNTGFGMPPLHRLSERGPLQHGVTDLGSRLDPRVIQLVLSIVSIDWDAQYSTRSQLLAWLNPASDELIKLRFTLPDQVTIRQIDVYPAQGPIYDVDRNTNKKMLKVGLSLIAPDPLFYDPDRKITSVIAQTGSPGFPIPALVPMTFGEDDIAKNIQINYPGTWVEYPEIELIGQMNDPVILHLDTDLKLDFTAYAVPPGEKLIIDLRYGHKTVVDQNGDNQIAALTADSDLTAWHLRPGTNNIYVTADNVGEFAKIIFRYYYRYIGV